MTGNVSISMQPVESSMNDRSTTENLARVCRPLVNDLLEPNPRIFWTDFLLTLCGAYAAAIVFLRSPWPSIWGWICFPGAILLLYRLAMFIHEIVHLRERFLPGFSLTWNLLAGIPLLIPSFLYESHLTHHSSQHYGTAHDGEYLPLARGTVGTLLAFLSQVFIQPLFIFLRFLIGTPISLLHHGLRRWIFRRASSLVINFRYLRPWNPEAWKQVDFWIEIACCLRAWSLLAFLAAGFAPWTNLLKFYALACGALSINQFRTLVAHRYRSDGELMPHDEQFLDSTNIVGGRLTELWAPLGLRYHALHHLLPAIPYHNLGKAHRRLMQQLAPDSLYHRANYDTARAVLRELWHALRQPEPPRRNVWLTH